ncbi:ABC transporter substrate-binding protein [Oscillospiraceae bacterium OttesenSCG-928-G22]|nr:ABC transporter substrate-binding protein [Oscillospiraceae bacterium OttesenSCG-928-G22]
MKRNVRILAMLLVLVMLLPLASCGTQGETPTQAPSGGASQNPSGDPATGDDWNRVIRMSVAGAPYADPGFGTDAVSNIYYINVYDTLVYPDNNDEIQPLVATGWETSDDGLTWTFTLREDVVFHDGTPLKASDVAFSANRLLATGQGYAFLFVNILDSVTADSDYTVTFKLKQAFAPFLSVLCRLYIMNETLIMDNIGTGSYGDFGDYGAAWLDAGHDAGSGPYYCSAWEYMTRVVCTRFDDYWEGLDPDAPAGFELVEGTETATVRAKFQNGELEISDQWQSNENFQALSEMPGVEISTMYCGSTLFLQMNNKKAPLDDEHVRKAIAYLVDYEQLWNTIFPGTRPNKSVIPMGLPGYTDDITTYEYNIEKAKEELALSKYADTIGDYPINLTWIAEVADEEKMALLIQSAAAPLGFNIEINKAPHMTNVDNVANLETTPHMNISFDVTDYAEAGSMLAVRFHSTNVGLFSQTEWLQNPEVDAMIDDALSTMDEGERMQKYAEITQWVMDHCICTPCGDQAKRHAYTADKFVWPDAEVAAGGGEVSKSDGYVFNFKNFRCK